MRTVSILTVPVYSSLCNLAFALRRAVFIGEQQVQDEEFDDLDRTATHLVAIAEGEVVGTLRLLAGPDATRIGRVAVARPWRGQGIGRQLLLAALAHARAAGATRFQLAAQHDKTGFYESFGFVVTGAPFDDGSGILHVEMRTA